jgi:hypothetical protein
MFNVPPRYLQSYLNMPPTPKNEGEELEIDTKTSDPQDVEPLRKKKTPKDAEPKKDTYDLSNKDDADDVHEANGENESTNLFAESKSERTNGRRIANAISNARCFGRAYNPSKAKRTIKIPGNAEEGLEERSIAPPILDKAWEYFEHYTLPRCFANRFDSAPGRKYSRAEPGEHQEKTNLYPVWGTPMGDMADFGIGVGMYFDMVRFFGIVALIAGFMSTPSILFFMNDYSSDDREGIQNSLNVGSAICTNTTWVPCPNCTMDVFDSWPTKTDKPPRIANATVGDSGLFFIRKNNCELNSTFSIMNLATIFFFAFATLVFMFLQRKMRARLDEGEQTSSDYSIQVKVSSRSRFEKASSCLFAYVQFLTCGDLLLC